MAIISFIANNTIRGIVPAGFYKNVTEIPGFQTPSASGLPSGNKFYHDIYRDKDSKFLWGNGPVTAFDIQTIDYSENNNLNEFWCRVFWGTTQKVLNHQLQPVTYPVARLLQYTDGAYKNIVELYVNSATTLMAAIRKLDGTIVNTITVAKLSDVPVINKEAWVDIRIKIHPSAGYIQCYNTNASMIGEYLGVTLADGLKPTHAATNSQQSTSWSDYDSTNYQYGIFTILADEPTFGMYVGTMYPKGPGSFNDNVDGSYETLGAEYRPNDYVSLAVNSGETKSFSVSVKNLADIGLPADYTVKSVKVLGAFDASSSKPDAVNMSMFIKQNDNSPHFFNVEAIPPNANSLASGKYIRRGLMFKNNPITGLPWSNADLSQVEIGYRVSED